MKKKTIEKWEWDFNLSNQQAGIPVGIELGFEKNNLLRNGIRSPPPPLGPSVEKQRPQMIKLRFRARQKSFFLSQDEQIC